MYITYNRHSAQTVNRPKLKTSPEYTQGSSACQSSQDRRSVKKRKTQYLQRVSISQNCLELYSEIIRT